MSKLKSRKFWLCVASFLASIATSVSGLQSGNDVVTAIGVICGVVSASIYAVCEASVDKASVEVNEEVTRDDVDRSDEADEE